ncbi:MAG: ArsR family transcriptional regulator [Candidatus Omnitrophota bacterium]|nr:ArsR family transcriptional regulator [Candidatus Omnitrophota bacterium]
MSKNLTDVQDVFLGKINHICNKFGLNNIMAQLYALSYLSKAPLSLDEMSERLKISKASVSINIRALERYGVVRKVWVKGSRKDYYEAEMDITKVIMESFKSMAERRLLEIDDILKSSYDVLDSVDLKNGKEEGVKVLKERLDKLKNFYTQAQVLFNLYNSGVLNKLLGGGLIKKKFNKGAEK